ncbi:MAG: HNH endonuclease [Chloroflexota bacterium]
MTVRPCLGCGALTSNGSRCADCQAQLRAMQERRRGTRQARGYDDDWLRVSRAAIAAQPWCSACLATDDLTADHIIPLSRGGQSDAGNIQVLCRACNSRKRER